MFQVSDDTKVYGPFSSRPVAREFIRMIAICKGKEVSDFKINAV